MITGFRELGLQKKCTNTADGQILQHYSFTADGLTVPDAAVNKSISVKLVTPLLTSVTPLLVMTSFWKCCWRYRIVYFKNLYSELLTLPPTNENITSWTLRKL